MTKAIDEIFHFLAGIIEAKSICISCRDRTKCSECLFNGNFKDLSAGNNRVKALLQKTFTKRKLTLNKYG
jgi:hypothetical protein